MVEKGKEPMGSRIRNINGPKYRPEDIVHSLGKIPPQALDLEEAVLGAMLIEKDAYQTVADLLKPKSFYKESHQRIFNAIKLIASKSSPIDLLTVTNQLRSTNELDLSGGPYYLVELTSRVNSAENIEYHSRIIIEQAMKRELIALAVNIQKEAFEYTSDVFELLDMVGSSLNQLTNDTETRQSLTVDKVVTEAIMEIEKAYQNYSETGSMVTGIPTGFNEVDKLTGGWQSSDLIVIAARPGMGKTTLALNIAENAIEILNEPVGCFSLEMSSIQLAKKLISSKTGISTSQMQKGFLQEWEFKKIHTAVRDFLDNPKLVLDDTPGITLEQLIAKIHKMVRKYGVKMVIIDYLQLLTLGYKNTNMNREGEISQITRTLKNLAKKLNIPIIILSQLSRSVEQRGGDKRPMLSDLRESGAIEQDADIVLFLYRPDYYGIMSDESGPIPEGMTEAIFAKHRNGPTRTVKLYFSKHKSCFSDQSYSELRPISNDVVSIDFSQKAHPQDDLPF